MGQNKDKKGVQKDENIFSASVRVLGAPIKMICDPIAQVCYPVLEEHWRERYRKPWPTKYARRMLILDMTLLTIIATLVVTAMIYAFVTPLFVLPALVNIDVFAPREIVSGAATEYDIAYRNNSNKNLGCAVVRMHLPAGTVLEKIGVAHNTKETSCPAPGSKDAGGAVYESDGADGPVVLVPVGLLQPHSHDLVRVHARTYGATGTLKVMTSELLYWEEAETVPARVSARNTWYVAASSLSLNGTHPKNLVRGREHDMTFSYKNVSTESIGPITLRLRAPNDFVLSDTTPPSAGEWTIDTLAPTSSGTLTIHGHFKETAGQHPPSIFTLSAYLHKGDKEFTIESLRQNADPKTSGFAITQEIVSPGRASLLPGETVNVKIDYRNNGASSLENVKIAITADSRFIEAASPATLTWEKTTDRSLAQLAPGAEGTLTAQFRIVRDITKDIAPMLHLSTTATYTLPDEPTNPLTVDTATVDLPVATFTSIQAAGLYYTKDGDQIGVGPLPPKVGETTKYRVFFDVANSSGEADGVTVEATLPSNVAWTGKYSVNAGQAIDWLPSTRTVRWEIGTLAPYTNSEGEHLGASFEVALTPHTEDAGAAPTLVTGITLSGKDATTGLTLHAEAESITTDLPFDKRAIGKGAVEK